MKNIKKRIIFCVIVATLVPNVYSMEKKETKEFFQGDIINLFFENLREEKIRFSVDEILPEVPEGFVEDLLAAVRNNRELSFLQKFFHALWSFAREMSGQRVKEELYQ